MLQRKPMKSLFVLALIIFGFTANAKNYYLSNSGNDSNNGTDPSTPWQSISKLNSFNFTSGDNILFERGGTFYGTITVSSSNLTFGAYGNGDDPVITGFKTVTNWTNLGGNIWESSSPISSLSSCNVVVVNGVNTAMGRYPNSGYLSISSISSGSLTSSSLSASATNWTGAEVVIKKERWIIDRKTITSASGTTIDFSSSSYTGHSGWGFFIQNDSRTLDTQNEWYYNPSTKKIKIYSTSTPSNVQVSTLSNLVYAVNRNNIVFNGIKFSGANSDAFYLGNFSQSTIQSCYFDFNYNTISGYEYGGSSPNITITGCTINHTNNNAIGLTSEFAGAKITNNLIKNSGVLPGMSGSGDGQAQGLNVMGNNYFIQYNEIDSTGYVPLGFNGSNIICDKNFVNYYGFVKDDGGGIYTGNPQAGVVISNNIILNGIGCDAGTGGTNNGKASGIYCDDNSSGMSILNNSVANAIYAGIFIHNGNNIKIRGNTTFNCGIGLLVDNDNSGSYTKGMVFNANSFVAITTGSQFTPQNQVCLSFKTAHSSGNDIANFGTADSNYYARPMDDNLTIIGTIYGIADNYYSLSTWKSYFGNDINSKKSPKTITNVNDLRFEYNPTSSNKTISLGANYIDLKGNSYNGSVMLAPYSSTVLIKNGPLTNNIAPTANAGSDQIIFLPTDSIKLTGSGNDSDGTITSYLWKKISGPSVTISNSTVAATTVNGLVQGNYQFELTVKDDKGAVGKDTVKITVNPASNKPPTADAGIDQTITLPTNSIMLTGSGNDSDGVIASYLWKKISGPSATISDSTLASTTVKGLVQGNYQFELTVIDNNGAVGTDIINVIVNSTSNKPPTANAGKDQTITLPTDNITLTGSGNDSDGTIVSYLWTKISGPSATISNSTDGNDNSKRTFQGNYQFELTVTDDKGAVGKDVVNVTVNPAPNIPPTASAGADQTINLPTDSISLTGIGTDSDGKIASYLWTKISGPSATISNSKLATTTVNGLLQGNYQFELK